MLTIKKFELTIYASQLIVVVVCLLYSRVQDLSKYADPKNVILLLVSITLVMNFLRGKEAVTNSRSIIEEVRERAEEQTMPSRTVSARITTRPPIEEESTFDNLEEESLSTGNPFKDALRGARRDR